MPPWLPPLLLAPFIGSFAGLLIRRLPAGRPVGMARSCCEACGHALGAPDLVPLLSFLALGGRCRWCRARISLVHPAAELACLAIAAGVVLIESDPLRIWLGCALGWTLLALAWIDWEHGILPDALTLPLVPAGLGAAWLLDPGSLAGHAAAAAIGYLALAGIGIGHRRLGGRAGSPRRGGAKLMAAAGAWVGLAALPTVVLLAALVGLAVAVGRRVAGRQPERGAALPFGAALCAGLWATWLGLDPVAFLAQRLS